MYHAKKHTPHMVGTVKKINYAHYHTMTDAPNWMRNAEDTNEKYTENIQTHTVAQSHKNKQKIKWK